MRALVRLSPLFCCAIAVFGGQPASADDHLVPSAYKTELTVLVGPVTGAPGDGGASLQHAIQRQLVARGVAIATTSSLPRYRIDGFVTMTEELKGEQSIFILWSVTDPQGDRLGTVHQRNTIRKGSLDGQWGLVADQAAEAAVGAIMGLLPPP
jgi:hypothetical protein